MTIPKVSLNGILLVAFCIVVGGEAWWFATRGAPAAKKADALPVAASVTQPLKEDQVNVVTLSPAAVGRLAIGTGVAQRKSVSRLRVYGGEVIIPPGQVIIVSAPLSGTLKAPAAGIPLPGQIVQQRQPIFQLLPLLSPEGRVNMAAAKIDADGQVKSAQAQVDAAQIALDRAKRVFQSVAGSRRAVDEAQAQHEMASKTLEAAKARRDLLQKVVGEVDKGTSAPLTIECPQSGLLRNVSAMAEQNVPSGAALFEVANLDRMWVRVPVYVGDLASVNTTADAQVTELTARPGAPSSPAKSVSAPPSANAAAGTVDLFYELDNRATKYSPGQRIGVALTLKDDAESLTVPWSAVIHDVHGGTWVYEHIGENIYARRRVVVRFVSGDLAVLASGPLPGAKVVIAGAAELFGIETGFSK